VWKAVALCAIVVYGLVVPEAVRADAFDDAVRLCAAIEKTGMVTECDVRGSGPTVDVRMNTNSAEARKICDGMVESIAQQTRSFAGKWKLRIFSPHSGEHPIAVGTLK
jgi:hypothetical protein